MKLVKLVAEVSRKSVRQRRDPALPEVATSESTQELAAAQDFWQLPATELAELLTLSRAADRVELKLTVPVPAHAATCAALGVDFAAVAAYHVYYLDTADRALDRHGVVVRVRSDKHKADDSVIKLRPVSPSDIPADLRHAKEFVVEVDGMPGFFVCSGALKAQLDLHDVERTMATHRPLNALFTEPQLRLLTSRLPPRVGLDDLGIVGPVDARRQKLVLPGFDRPLLAEQWTYPDGSQILELSTRCAPDATLQVGAQLAGVLQAYGIDLTGPQQTKTRATLDFFAPRTAPPTATD